jgi:RNA polymerase sigma factor for flagellar operon FliA
MITDRDWKLAKEGNISKRNKIIVEYQWLVHKCARNVAKKLPNHLDVNDLISTGQFGLIDAIKRFEPEMQYKFPTYATTRIRGSILDALRVQDWIPRSVRNSINHISTATEELTNENSRTPTVKEISERTGITEAKIYSARDSGRVATAISLSDDSEDGSLHDRIVEYSDDLGMLVESINGSNLSDAIGGLADRERITLAMHYYLGHTFSEVGQRFGVTESRVCQIHTLALKKLRKGMGAKDWS